ncbi:hypothetical protein MOQ_000652 [Trypanosoma cruzi marinkellei]|uniref:YEATS domain-containing protein n=1 Tax=Trypanosoma cruzi marinkellei TaxID=85056 RepID=K2NVW3_TRYCR|nr:hypothetical protein MOQ_000652 [Trypanosoma cruzi marinkellei]
MEEFTRVFTIHFDGTVYNSSVDCRVVSTLRELLVKTLPAPLSPPASSAVLPKLKDTATWVDGYACSFGGQRLSLAVSTEVAPTTLYVALATRNRVDEKTSVSGHAGPLKRRRSFSTGKRGNNDNDNVDRDDGNNNNNNNSSGSSSSGDSESGSSGSSSNGSVNSAVRQRRQSYWHHGTAENNTGKNSNDNNNSSNYEEAEYGDEEEREDEDYDGYDDSHGSSVEDWNDGVDDANTEMFRYDGRQQRAVLPIIVGGVVRLIDIESRDKSHQWTVYIRGLFNETDYLARCIESVQFVLDPSFTPSERIVKNAPFELTEVGWGEFVVKMQVKLRYYPRPVQVALSSSSFASMATHKSEVEVASAFLASQPMVPLSGISRGPVLSPVVSVLSRHHYQSGNHDKSSSSTTAVTSVNKLWGMVKTEVKVEKDDLNDEAGGSCGTGSMKPSDVQSPGQPAIMTLGMSPGVVTLSHLLRFSHRPRRFHCIPPQGRSFEPEEHVGYTIVETPVVTEQYDEIVVPDPPAPILEVTEALPNMFRRRIATFKTARAMAQQQQRPLFGSGAPLGVAAAFSEGGVSCWDYIMQEEPDDAVLAESYLESIETTVSSLAGAQQQHAADVFSSAFYTASQQQEQQQLKQQALHGIDAPIVVKLPRGRRKLTGAEIDLSALRTAKKGLVEAIEKMRRELVLRQAAQTYQHYM